MKKLRGKKKLNWEDAMKDSPDQKKVYVSTGSYIVGDYIEHNLFGVGFVERLFGVDKMEVLFEDKKRILLHSSIF